MVLLGEAADAKQGKSTETDGTVISSKNFLNLGIILGRLTKGRGISARGRSAQDH